MSREEAFVVALVAVTILTALTFGLWMERTRFDACLGATADARYCTLVHPWGAHR